jgi:hypothetical protein
MAFTAQKRAERARTEDESMVKAELLGAAGRALEQLGPRAALVTALIGLGLTVTNGQIVNAQPNPADSK